MSQKVIGLGTLFADKAAGEHVLGAVPEGSKWTAAERLDFVGSDEPGAIAEGKILILSCVPFQYKDSSGTIVTDESKREMRLKIEGEGPVRVWVCSMSKTNRDTLKEIQKVTTGKDAPAVEATLQLVGFTVPQLTKKGTMTQPQPYFRITAPEA
jgi:hypothetical protein